MCNLFTLELDPVAHRPFPFPNPFPAWWPILANPKRSAFQRCFCWFLLVLSDPCLATKASKRPKNVSEFPNLRLLRQATGRWYHLTDRNTCQAVDRNLAMICSASVNVTLAISVVIVAIARRGAPVRGLRGDITTITTTTTITTHRG